jgi:cytidine deaminase
MSEEALSIEDATLLKAAHTARTEAYAPFSKFYVGAAVMTSTGELFSGCNVEISSYSLSCCAERVAVFKAVSAGHTELVSCAVVTDTTPPASPCGACRQVLSDFSSNLRLVLSNTGDDVKITNLEELLPHAFKPIEVLKKLNPGN